MAVFSLEPLLPTFEGLQLDKVEIKPQRITLELTSTGDVAFCPRCAEPSRQIHSRYTRQVEDLPWNAIAVLLLLKLRRFFCINQTCQRKIFVERLSPTITAYARRTGRLYHKLTQLAFELGGQAGTSICEKLGMACSASSLLRYIRKTPLPQEGSIKVVGVDEWAIRKAQTYGTIVVDLERHRPVALLPDRTKETFSAWLEKHPEVEVISRDRASSYSQAADLAAPQAIQVADRFHLLQNLAQTVQRVFEHKAKELRLVAEHIAELERVERATQSVRLLPSEQTVQSTREDEVVSRSVTQTQTEVAAPPTEVEFNQRQLNFEQVKLLHQQGYSQRAIAVHLGVHRKTVKNYILSETLPRRGSQTTVPLSSVSPYLGYLTKRWQAGFYNKRQLWLEIQQQGYTGTVSSIYRALAKFPAPDLALVGQAPQANKRLLPKLSVSLKPISAKKATWLLLHKDQKLKAEDLIARQVLLEQCAVALPVYKLARDFQALIRERKGAELDKWLLQAKQSEIKPFERFAESLKRDYKAVKAGVSLEYNNGQTEGQVNRLKWLKRAMFGRAKFELLSRRVLYQRAA